MASFVMVRQVIYDQQHLNIGDHVERLEEWKEAPEGHRIAKFRTRSGKEIPLIMDEVTPASDSIVEGG